MISRRQIISGQPNAGVEQQGGSGMTNGGASSSSSSSAASKPSAGRTGASRQSATSQEQQSRQLRSANQSQSQAKMAAGPNKTSTSGSQLVSKKRFQQQQQQQQRPKQTANKTSNSDDYLMSSSSNHHQYEEDYAVDERTWRQHQQQQQNDDALHNSSFNNSNSRNQQDNNNMNEPFRQHFDPYSIYSDEEDVWCSEERLFEDHLEEIYNKWPLLDDDIWCKLIIMERNRRIGKAYARVPIVTIDGSHELSYDGYKLALNGFDNPDRDEETEECRKRIGKGIKIKMDNFGNILIKRMSKAGVYVKEWINPAPGVSGGSSNSTNGSSGAGVGRSMPSRQQLIKAASMAGAGHHQMSSLMNGGTPSSSSGGSSMDSPNDSAICDEVITIGGRLELDKIYVMFDIKKFQANISQELCRPYPDRRKLEQQCFSIVGLTRDSEDILNLPCWLMVINIVAIEMLNERLPLLDDDRHGYQTGFLDTRRLHGPRAPSFVGIFDQHGGPNQSSNGGSGGGGNHRNLKDNQHQHHQAPNKEEDPYSLPANASSSDVRSSINEYGTASTKNMSNYIESTQAHHPSRFYGGPKNIYPAPGRRNASVDQTNGTGGQIEQLMQLNRSKSNYNIYGPTSKPPTASRYNNSERYNNNSSIYSPGHMLVPHSGDHSVPPKLPPRDFVAKKGQRSKSSSNLIGHDDNMTSKYDDQNENIYSTGQSIQLQDNNKNIGAETQAKSGVQRKTKRNRFLESLKAPLELAKSGRSSSVLGVPAATNGADSELALNNNAIVEGKKSSKTKSGGGFSKAKNLRSFLGVGSKSKSSASDESTYVHVADGLGLPMKHSSVVIKSKQQDSGEADSVVDPNEELDDSHHVITNSSASPDASYNDLDIPTPDYETDENIYALESQCNNYQSAKSGKMKQANKNGSNNTRSRRYSTSNNNNISESTEMGQMKAPKDDLYYSGFRAHVPHHHHHQHVSSTMARTPDQMSCMNGPRGPDLTGVANSRYLMRTSRMLAAKMNGRDMIYGSTLGLQQQQQPSLTGSRYRSASMQRYYSATASKSNQRISSNSHMYDADLENPYAMSAGLDSLVPGGGGGGGGGGKPLDDSGQLGHYGVTTASSCIGGRRRSISKLMQVPGRGMITSGSTHHDIGRSSSGIYGINSGSSSSEYADWQPQVRKVNSSGYLNSIFKSQQLNKPPSGPNPQMDQLNNNNNNNNINSKSNTAAHGYNNNLSETTGNKTGSQVRNYASRTLKSTQVLNNKDGNAASNVVGNKKQAAASSVLNGPAYRSYDSSNDSDPSYTNSSDGLDIYDQIGAHHPRMSHNNIHNNHHRHHMQQQQQQQQHPNSQLHNHNQFLEHNLAPVHVGEWENMYDR